MQFDQTCDRVFQSRQPEEAWDYIKLSDMVQGNLAIINLVEDSRFKHSLPIDMKWQFMHIWTPIPDKEFPGMEEFFINLAKMTDVAYTSGYSLLFHCAAGISRSTTANIAFRICQFGETRDEAFHAIKTFRPCAHPNKAFWEVLLEVERELLGYIESKEPWTRPNWY